MIVLTGKNFRFEPVFFSSIRVFDACADTRFNHPATTTLVT